MPSFLNPSQKIATKGDTSQIPRGSEFTLDFPQYRNLNLHPLAPHVKDATHCFLCSKLKPGGATSPLGFQHLF